MGAWAADAFEGDGEELPLEENSARSTSLCLRSLEHPYAGFHSDFESQSASSNDIAPVGLARILSPKARLLGSSIAPVPDEHPLFLFQAL